LARLTSPLSWRLERAKHYAYRAGKFEAVIVPLKVQHFQHTPANQSQGGSNQKKTI